jgi:hypothetical protein
MKLKQQSRVSQKRKVQDLNASAKFFQTFKEELITTLLKLFYEIEREGKLHNTLYEASITPIPKLDKDTVKGVLQSNLFNELKCKNPQENVGKMNSTAYQKDHTPM